MKYNMTRTVGMRNLIRLAAVLFTVASVLPHHSASAQSARMVWTISGGGAANMDDGQGPSYWGVEAKLLSDGSASGFFECVDQIGDFFPGNFFGPITSWSRNVDGTINLHGTGATLSFPPNPLEFTTNLEFTVTIQRFGGPGVGHWTLDVPDFGGVVCIETLTSG